MRQHEFNKGDLVWWTMGGGMPLPFEKGNPFVGIVVNVSELYGGIEVFWFNNGVFKVLNHEELMKADIKNPFEKF